MPVEISSGDVLDPTIHLERPTDMAAKWIVALMTSMGLVISKQVKSSLPTVEQLCAERPAKPDKMQLLTRGLRAPLNPSREFRVPSPHLVYQRLNAANRVSKTTHPF